MVLATMAGLPLTGFAVATMEYFPSMVVIYGMRLAAAVAVE